MQVMIFFSAHGVPLAYVEEAGDPYKAEMEECVDLIMEELENRGITSPCTLAYQVHTKVQTWNFHISYDKVVQQAKYFPLYTDRAEWGLLSGWNLTLTRQSLSWGGEVWKIS